MKIFLYYVGKARDTHANAMAEEYIKRSGRFATCEMREIHPGRFDPWAKHPSARKILLDPAGKALDSKKLTALFDRDLVFVIGGADGLPPEWKPKADLLRLAVGDDHAARAGAGGAGRADLSRADDAAGASLPALG